MAALWIQSGLLNPSPWLRWSWPLSSGQLEVPLQLGAWKFTAPQKVAGAEEVRLLSQTRNQVSHTHFLAGDWVERSWKFSKGLYPSGSRVGIVTPLQETYRLSWWLSGKESTCQWRWPRFDPWVRKIPWRRKWQPTPVFLPGKSHGQRDLEGCSPWGLKKSQTRLGN